MFILTLKRLVLLLINVYDAHTPGYPRKRYKKNYIIPQSGTFFIFFKLLFFVTLTLTNNR